MERVFIFEQNHGLEYTLAQFKLFINEEVPPGIPLAPGRPGLPIRTFISIYLLQRINFASQNTYAEFIVGDKRSEFLPGAPGLKI